MKDATCKPTWVVANLAISPILSTWMSHPLKDSNLISLPLTCQTWQWTPMSSMIFTKTTTNTHKLRDPRTHSIKISRVIKKQTVNVILFQPLTWALSCLAKNKQTVNHPKWKNRYLVRCQRSLVQDLIKIFRKNQGTSLRPMVPVFKRDF